MIDLTGQTFGDLVAVEPTSRRSFGNVVWSCTCVCGATVEVNANKLRFGVTKSCGCRKGRVATILNIARTKHGQAKTYDQSHTYKAWCRMKSRCGNPRSQSYEHYGARGITVDPTWASSFESFLLDMGERPDGYTLDRLDPNRGYVPGNCRWVPASAQGEGRTSNRYLTFNGETLTITGWARRLGCKISALRMRLTKGWSVEQAITQPFGSRKPRKVPNRGSSKESEDRAKFRAYYKHLYRTPADDLTFEQWQEILVRYQHCCAYCGTSNPRTMDHVTPTSEGGLHTASNVVPACRSCNSRKGVKYSLSASG